MPWRVPPERIKAGEKPDPYRVWLSEIMLQQTTVATVSDYFVRFIALWPTLADLAAASEEEVLKAWAGLGYYSRARNLKKCADTLVRLHDGTFPNNAAALQKLPGIGSYTAAAIAAIAFNERAPVIDGNIERVIARYREIKHVFPKAKSFVLEWVSAFTPSDRPGDFAQAMMDLGATICTPRNPSCPICPLHADCWAYNSGDPEAFPYRTLKRTKPKRIGAAFVVTNSKGEVLLKKRGESGLLAGMSEVPTTTWTANSDGSSGKDAAPFPAKWKECGSVRHVFTHFELELMIYRAAIDMPAPEGHWWSLNYNSEALPTLMKKVIETALSFKSH